MIERAMFSETKARMADDIILQRKAGGSVIDHKPAISINSNFLYVGCGSKLRTFSTDSGEHLHDVDFEEIDPQNGNIVSVCLHPFVKETIILCFDKGRIITWSFETNTVVSNMDLNVEGTLAEMKLHICSQEYETCDIIVAVTNDTYENRIRLHVFSYETGILKFTIKRKFDHLIHGWSVTGYEGKSFVAGIKNNRLTIFNLKTKVCNNDIIIGSDRYFTCVTCHPTEECVAVGDNTGRVIIYYEFLVPNNASPHYVYHWHSLPVNDIVFSHAEDLSQDDDHLNSPLGIPISQTRYIQMVMELFSPMGTSFYSGGNEHVLVKWSVKEPDIRNFLPRLPAPLVHLAVAPENQFIAVSTLDNGIIVVDPQMKIRCNLQQFTWGFVTGPRMKQFPCGLVVDPRSNCIVLNGRPGHIQFYSPQYSSLIYNMDITRENYLAQEKIKNITNTEVIATQFSSDGLWLATSEARDNATFHCDTYLKFWQFDQRSQLYKTNTCVSLNHTVSKILFQPPNKRDVKDENMKYMAVTLCDDKKFRFFNYEVQQEQSRRKSILWNCHSIGYYRDHPLADICFSNDGSLLGAAFGPCLTLWDTESIEMKCTLSKGNEPLKQIVFGQEDCSFIAISVNESKIFVWNLLSLTIMWTFEIQVSILVADPLSEYVALFTPDNSVYIFRPSSPEIAFQMDNICEDAKILSALFYPKDKSRKRDGNNSNSSCLVHSSLYFFTSKQYSLFSNMAMTDSLERKLQMTQNACIRYVCQLRKHEHETPHFENLSTLKINLLKEYLMAFENVNSNSGKMNSLSYIPEKASVTPFQALMAKEMTSDVQKQATKTYLQFGGSWNQTISQFVNSQPHAMPPVSLLCEPFLQSLIISRPSDELQRA